MILGKFFIIKNILKYSPPPSPPSLEIKICSIWKVDHFMPLQLLFSPSHIWSKVRPYGSMTSGVPVYLISTHPYLTMSPLIFLILWGLGGRGYEWIVWAPRHNNNKNNPNFWSIQNLWKVKSISRSPHWSFTYFFYLIPLTNDPRRKELAQRGEQQPPINHTRIELRPVCASANPVATKPTLQH